MQADDFRSETAPLASISAQGLYDLSWHLAAATIFLGAFFLFAVEPMIAKAILPWFGGSAQVWITCLVFFQIALLAGYLYAHLLTEHLDPQWQIRIHMGLLAVSLAFLPVIPSETWKPSGGSDPLPLILGLLTATIGLPFLLLSSTGPLVQCWLARAKQAEATPLGAYRLFALSNFGSMLALGAYPVLIEPGLAMGQQAWAWSAGYAVFVLFSMAVAWRFGGTGAVPSSAAIVFEAEKPSWTERAIWFALSAAPSALLLTLTNYMLQNIAAIPLFWVIPLALYLVSFIFAFGSLSWYRRPLWYGLFFAAIVAMALGMSNALPVGEMAMLPVFDGALFICCMVCHGELAALRPPPRHLTAYYLTISAGGAAGGLFVAVASPALFNANYELSILIPLTVLIAMLAASRNYRAWAGSSSGWTLLFSAVFLLCALAGFMARYMILQVSGNVFMERNFYGALKVRDAPALANSSPMRLLLNGNINHGSQFSAPDRRAEPLTYFSHRSGVGIALDELGKDGPLRTGVIGLGAGTIAAYSRAGDTYRFYELNPAVESIAREQFWYLGDSAAEWNVVLGDARLSLEAEPSQQFDVLVVDAFLSDAIPMHLLTREAMTLYWQHLKSDGVLAVHVSNRYVGLEPVVANSAAEHGKTARLIRNAAVPEAGIFASDWVLVSSRPGFFDRDALKNAQPIAVSPGFRPWTDDYSNLWGVLRAAH